jgi:hypothetical protein
LPTPHLPVRAATVRLAALLGVLFAGALVVLGVLAPASHADANANNYDCRGHIEKGVPQPDDDGDTQVKYVFACNGKILGYQIQPSLSDTGFDVSTVVVDLLGNPVTTDSFSCQGDFPGYGINCVGTYSGNYGKVIGQFSIATKLCAEPRVDPLLTVVYATADAKGVVTQSISGPYDLGRPRGCKPSSRSGKTRIPAFADSRAKARAAARARARRAAARRA